MLETLWHFLDLYSAADLDGAFSPLDHFAIDARGIRIGDLRRLAKLRPQSPPCGVIAN
jgi:hypothetical protein